ncbi:MAG: hypothetical protein FRX48_03085 [Lasallia pustulata]|uniref:Uncharacterized protein n=1 Tax=Lasallia pustulata TaxID=136370 RepID=A0A5M8PWA6_9LECA|nr:MAG: hypothetical protein FRX48_03085 [Lasallia pustulata]
MAARPSTPPEDLYFPFIPTIWLMTAPSINPPQPPYLPNTAIHPIFSRTNCTDPIDPIHGIAFTPAQYDQLYPAIALASKFLTTASCLPWWVRLCLSTIAFDPATSRHHLRPVPATLATLDATRLHLLQHAPRIRIRFAHPGQYATARIYAQTTIPTRTLILITLRHDHLRYLTSGAGLARASEPQRLCFFFHVAQLLVHEAAHAIAHALPDAPLVEPYHDLSEPEAEFGSSWENSAFGGRAQALSGDCKVAKGARWGMDEEEYWRNQGTKGE